MQGRQHVGVGTRVRGVAGIGVDGAARAAVWIVSVMAVVAAAGRGDEE